MSGDKILVNGSEKAALGVGIIGCGLIGQKRAAALSGCGRLLACADINLSRAEHLANRYGGIAYSSWSDLLAIPGTVSYTHLTLPTKRIV